MSYQAYLEQEYDEQATRAALYTEWLEKTGAGQQNLVRAANCLAGQMSDNFVDARWCSSLPEYLVPWMEENLDVEDIASILVETGCALSFGEYREDLDTDQGGY